ncbi:hypothetical protein, partial [Klebsiella pneumoniae]|uniref:hypothetical protein n=1 Tax=Klebsiella pneumoniae TaxID=573 RepID=UPI0025A15953
IVDDVASEINVISDISYSTLNLGVNYGRLTMLNDLTNTYTTANNAKVNYYSGEYEILTENNGIDFKSSYEAETSAVYTMA